MEKKIILLGGFGGIWGNQFHQQDRCYDRKGIAQSINAMGNNGGVIRRWIKSESGRQQVKAL